MFVQLKKINSPLNSVQLYIWNFKRINLLGFAFETHDYFGVQTAGIGNFIWHSLKVVRPSNEADIILDILLLILVSYRCFDNKGYFILLPQIFPFHRSILLFFDFANSTYLLDIGVLAKELADILDCVNKLVSILVQQ